MPLQSTWPPSAPPLGTSRAGSTWPPGMSLSFLRAAVAPAAAAAPPAASSAPLGRSSEAAAVALFDEKAPGEPFGGCDPDVAAAVVARARDMCILATLPDSAPEELSTLRSTWLHLHRMHDLGVC